MFYTIYMNNLKIVLNTVSLLLIVDFISFMFWALSGDIPFTSFYFGAITKNIINLIISILC